MRKPLRDVEWFNLVQRNTCASQIEKIDASRCYA